MNVDYDQRIAELEQRIKERADDYGQLEFKRGVEHGLAKAASILRIPLIDLETYPDMPTDHSANGHKPVEDKRNRPGPSGVQYPLATLCRILEMRLKNWGCPAIEWQLSLPKGVANRVLKGHSNGQWTGLEKQTKIHTPERLRQALAFLESQMEAEISPETLENQSAEISSAAAIQSLSASQMDARNDFTAEVEAKDYIFEPEVADSDYPLALSLGSIS